MHTKTAILTITLLGPLALATGCESAHAAQASSQAQVDTSTPLAALASSAPRKSKKPTAAPTASPHTPAPIQVKPSLQCIQVNSTSFKSCKDAGGFDSTCATAKCSSGYTLTGGGGSCSAGNRMVKGLSPNLSKGEFGIMCEKQGVKPRASAICCKL